jgi:hypothetical protein
VIAEKRVAEKRRELEKALEPLIQLGCDRGELLRLTKAVVEALGIRLLTPAQIQSRFFGMSRSALDRLPARVRDFAEEIERLHGLPISPSLRNPAAAELPRNLQAYARLLELWRDEVERASSARGRAAEVLRAERALVSYLCRFSGDYSQGRASLGDVCAWLYTAALARGIADDVAKRCYDDPERLRQRLEAAKRRSDRRARK